MTYRILGWNTDVAESLHVNEALNWHAIQLARSLGDRFYDLGGISRSTAEALLIDRDTSPDSLPSTDRFKAAFGGHPVLLPETRILLTVALIGRASTGVAARAMNSTAVNRLAVKVRRSG